MIDARAIGHATFETPDIERAIEYYTQILGLHVADRGPKRAVLVTHIGREAVVLEAAGAARCASISLQVAPGTELGDVAKVLSASEGIASERRSGVTPGIAEVLSFTDPNGVKVELYTEGKPSRARDTAAIGPLKLGHIAFCTGDVKKLTEFYCRVLGFRVSDWMEDFFCFLRCGPDHHTVNFATAKAPKLHHVAFELKDWAHMQNACEVLGRKNLQILWGWCTVRS